MTTEQLQATLEDPTPPVRLPVLVQALWWEAHGDWERAHQIAQDVTTPQAAWVHAYLHRCEGDLGNAGYWYRQAGQLVCKVTLREEWVAITTDLLGTPAA